MAANEEFTLEILLETALVTRSQLEQARGEAHAGESVIAVLIRTGELTQEDITRALAAHSAMDFVDLAQMTLSPEVLEQMPSDVARRFKVVPIAFTDSALMIAVSDPLNFDIFDALQHRLAPRDLEFVCATPDSILSAIRKFYGTAEDAVDELTGQINGEILIGDVETVDTDGDTGDAPIIKMVTSMLFEAYNMRASDIHLEPLEKRFRVRFRIDGVLHEMNNPPKKLQSAIISRLKIMTGSMSIAEKRLPQDGRIQAKMGKKQVDLRVSTVPTTHGESIVMRILDKSSLALGLPQLGFLSDDQEIFEQLLKLPDGILLVTGPTGSGKTTTLYGCLHYINKPDKKLITVEDPVEYQMGGINQVQVNTDIGMTFPAALRSILRQAPNIIMIGEIRDAETANIAINASLTGHLVFSTLHTNDAPSAVARLVDIGVQPFLVSSAVRAIVAQRLVRKLCPKCKKPHELSESEISALGLDRSQLGEATVMKGAGCENCKHLGYKGRMGIFEIFLIDDEVRHMVNNKASTVELRKRAREMGMRSLREDGIRKVLAGLTSAEEVISVSAADAD
ncbi:MAG: type ii/iv secretion system protein [Chthoniobacteraceae bacterium]|nr:type ii/iv secretion system protein [Chthoniobacteraceae bacterium]